MSFSNRCYPLNPFLNTADFFTGHVSEARTDDLPSGAGASADSRDLRWARQPMGSGTMTQSSPNGNSAMGTRVLIKKMLVPEIRSFLPSWLRLR